MVEKTSPIDLPMDAIADYCRRWHIRKLEVFGSVLRDDFGPDSDLDFLATFEPDARMSLFSMVRAEQELAALVDRPVDLVDRAGIEESANWIRRQAILDTAKPIYVA